MEKLKKRDEAAKQPKPAAPVAPAPKTLNSVAPAKKAAAPAKPNAAPHPVELKKAAVAPPPQ